MQDCRHCEGMHAGRKQIVRIGIGVMRIFELSGLSHPTVRDIIDRCPIRTGRSRNDQARAMRHAGRRLLADEQEPLVRQIICGKRPGMSWIRGRMLLLRCLTIAARPCPADTTSAAQEKSNRYARYKQSRLSYSG